MNISSAILLILFVVFALILGPNFQGRIDLQGQKETETIVEEIHLVTISTSYSEGCLDSDEISEVEITVPVE